MGLGYALLGAGLPWRDMLGPIPSVGIRLLPSLRKMVGLCLQRGREANIQRKTDRGRGGRERGKRQRERVSQMMLSSEGCFPAVVVLGPR